MKMGTELIKNVLTRKAIPKVVQLKSGANLEVFQKKGKPQKKKALLKGSLRIINPR